MKGSDSMSKTIYLVRHCKAEGQAFDAKLTPTGMMQSELLTEFLYDKQINSIVSSPYKRAVDSIKPLAKRLNLPINEDNRLGERVLSSLERDDYLEMLENSFKDLDICYEGGESSRQAMNRAIGVIEDVLKGSANNIVIATHGNLMSLILKHYEPSFGFKEWKSLSNPDVYCLKFEGDSPQIVRIWQETIAVPLSEVSYGN